MKRVLTISILVLAAILAPVVHSQTVTIVSTQFGDSAGHPYSGLVMFQPTLSSGQPTSYQKSGGGTVTSTYIQVMAVAGAFSVVVPDTSVTSPKNICFKLTAPGITSGYACLQPHYTATSSGDWCQAGICDLDNYGPNVPPQPTVPVGPQGLPGTAAAGGTNGQIQVNNLGSLGGVTLTTTGTSGPATILGGNFNIPQYSANRTTTYPLTGASSGGAIPGTTFNGSAAQIFDYHTLGAEAALGNPGTNGYVLSSTAGGVRSWIAPGSGSFTAAGDLSGSGASQTVIGIQGHLIAAPVTAGYVHWSGSAWEYINPSGAGTVTTSGSPVSPNVACFSAATTIGPCTSANIQTAIGASVYNAYLGYTPAHSGANSDITSLSGLTTPLTVAQGGIGAATSAANTLFGNLTASSAASGFSTAHQWQPSLGIVGQTFNVMDPVYGAVGNASTDDTVAIQAAYTACFAAGGGTVQFPGGHAFLHTSTINTFYGCGHMGGSAPGSPTNALISPIVWGGCPSGGTYPACNAATVDTITSITVASNVGTNVNCTSGGFKYCSATFPNGLSTPYYATVTATGTLPSVNDFMYLDGLTSTNGVQLNKTACSVSSVGSGNFTCLIPKRITAGTYSDSGTATRIGVQFASSSTSSEAYNTPCNHLDFRPLSGTAAVSHPDIALYYGVKTDTGSDIHGCQFQGDNLYGVYYGDGAYNTHWDTEWRIDGVGVAGIYLPLDYLNTLSLSHGEMDNNRSSVTGSTTSGGLIFFDDSKCGNPSYVDEYDVRAETNESITSGLGVHTGVACNDGTTYSGSNEPNVYLSIEKLTVAPGNVTSQGTVNSPAFVVSPASNTFFQINAKSSAFPSAYSNSWNNFQGMNYANLLYSVGSDGIITDFDYSIPINTLYASSIGGPNGKNPHQFYGDTMVQRLWMNGVPASSWQQTDAAFSALPNGTTLYAGDIIEVPAVWKTSAPRYSFYNVAQEGTTGTLNSGATTCTTGIANWITVSSVTGLIEGQHVTCGSNTNMKISHINAANPAAVLVYAVWSTSVGSPVTLSYSAPVLGPEIQLPTKAAGAPSSGAFIQGDVSQNSSAAANGVAMYVNTAAGSPGTFNGVPLGNSTGQINTTQISNTTGTGGTAAVLATAPTITNQTDVGTSATVPCPRTDYGYGSGNGTTQYCKITGTLAASPTNNTQKVTIVTTSSSYPGNQMALDIDLINLAASAVESSHWKIIGDTTNGFNVSQSSQEQDPLLAGSSKLLLSAVTVSNSTTFYFYVSSTNTVSGQNWQADIASYNYSTPNIASITVAATQSLSPTRAGWAAYGGTAAGITGGITNAMLPVVPTIISSGSISTLAAPSGVVVCTTTCAVTIPTPAAGNQFCVRNAPGSATVITLNAMGASTYYELTTHAGWGTANHTLVSGGVATDQICLTGYDSTHYMVASFTGTWTD